MPGFLKNGIGGVIAGALGGELGFSEFLMGDCKVGFEIGPSFLNEEATSPIVASVGKYASLEDNVVGVGHDLLWRVGCIGRGG